MLLSWRSNLCAKTTMGLILQCVILGAVIYTEGGAKCYHHLGWVAFYTQCRLK